jgi:hypothetical protein
MTNSGNSTEKALKAYEVDPAEETAKAKFLLRQYVAFLKICGYNPQFYRMDYTILKAVVKRYLMDVERLHNFHGMPRIDCHKIAGYLTYWLCRLKPIVVDKPQAYYGETHPVKHLRHPFFINEMFAVTVGVGCINATRKDLVSGGGVAMSKEFFNSLTYGLKYRYLNGDTLSMMYYMIDAGADVRANNA